MADAIIGPLVGRLQALALSEAQAVVAVSDDIRRLRDKLMWLQAFLREADAKRHGFSDEFTKVWLQQTRDAVFDAEDAVDHYYLQVQVDMSRYPGWARSCMGYIATFTTQIAMRHNLSRKIKKINSSLEDIIKNKEQYKLDDGNQKPQVSWKSSTSISYTRKDDFRQPQVRVHEEQRKKLVAALSLTEQEHVQKKDGDHHHPVVISVFGKSGVGKTTLVRDIYEKMVANDKIRKIFGVHVMESFAPYLTATTIIQQIVQRLTPDDRNCPKSKVREMLGTKLKGKKYLLVIDGEVSSTEWNEILDKLPPGAIGSRVVHITQDKLEEPPSKHRHVSIHLQPLHQDSTMDLFRERLVHTEPQDEESLDEILKQNNSTIFRITEGLPLSVVLLSGLVQTKEFSEWEQVFNYLKSKKSKRLDSLLSMCFDDLPHELKCCFLYFAALPANITIEANTLVCMWMAEGFLRPITGKRIEKVGYIYLNELIARNLVNPVHMDDDDFGDVSKSVTIQNKVHEFLQFEAQEASFVEVQIGDDIPTFTSARRLSLQNYKDKYAALANPLPKLRSIFSHFEQEGQIPRTRRLGNIDISRKKNMKSHIRGLLRGSEYLRVIKLQGIDIGAKLPDEIGNVVHLQYLGITSCLLKKIPQSIGRLTSLQTLDVRETLVQDLPLTFWRIKTLRHVSGFSLRLPKRIGDLNLKHLKTLNSIWLDNDDQHGLVGTLAQMVNLRYLHVWNVSERNVKDLCGALEKLEDLRTLILQGKIIPSSVFTNSSSRRIKYMVLQGELQLPSQLNGMVPFLPNIVMLSLERTNVSQEFITKLAGLPILATLALNSGSYKDERLVFFSGEFRSLKKLKIDEDLLSRVERKEGALPMLKNVDISNLYTGQHQKLQLGEEQDQCMIDHQLDEQDIPVSG